MIRLFENRDGKWILKYTVFPEPNLFNHQWMSRSAVLEDAEREFRLTGNVHKVTQKGYAVYYADGVPF